MRFIMIKRNCTDHCLLGQGAGSQLCYHVTNSRAASEVHAAEERAGGKVGEGAAAFINDRRIAGVGLRKEEPM
jgi:hypothetical protein